MKEQMKKLLGFWPVSLDMPPKSSRTFTKPIPLSLGLFHLLSLDVFTCSNISERNSFFYYNPMFHFSYSSFSMTSDFSNSSPSNSVSISTHFISCSNTAMVLSLASLCFSPNPLSLFLPLPLSLLLHILRFLEGNLVLVDPSILLIQHGNGGWACGHLLWGSVELSRSLSDCQDPVRSKIDPLPLPQLHSNHPLRLQHYANQTPNSEHPLRPPTHYHRSPRTPNDL